MPELSTEACEGETNAHEEDANHADSADPGWCYTCHDGVDEDTSGPGESTSWILRSEISLLCLEHSAVMSES